MNRGIYVALSGTLAQERRLETLTNNLANVNTPGFKKDKAVFTIDTPPVDRQMRPGAGILKDKIFVETSRIFTDFSTASQSRTGNTLDLALSGDGFFEVMTPNGPRYTRNGSFRVGESKELVTSEGFKVMGDTGPIRIDGGEVRVEKDGSVSVGDNSVGKLKIVDFSKPYALKKEAENLYLSQAQAAPTSAEVRQGYLEEANVSIIREMTAMIDTMRGYQSYVKVIQSMDEATGKVINEVGRV